MTNELGFRFECQQCGKCCQKVQIGIPLFVYDIQRISRYMQLNQDEFISRYCSMIIYHIIEAPHEFKIPVILLKTNFENCRFLVDRKCGIQEVKPYMCATSPFVSIILQDKEVFRNWRSSCSGYNRGCFHSAQEISMKLRQELKLENDDLEHNRNGFFAHVKEILGKEVIFHEGGPRQNRRTAASNIIIE